jgi:hypothetical protein
LISISDWSMTLKVLTSDCCNGKTNLRQPSTTSLV